MAKLLIAAQILSIISFLFYGTTCLASKKMFREFSRYKLSQFRITIGVLQIVGSIGLAVGFFVPWLALLASLGLAIQMFLGVVVRIRIKDNFVLIIPALIFCLLN
jgi:uncharacterized membrane protein YphA (DoxX/SURF4 family)